MRGDDSNAFNATPTGHLAEAMPMMVITSPISAMAMNRPTHAKAKTRARREPPRKLRFQEFVNPLHRASSWRRSTGSPP
jgi:hypothetical protein